MDRLCGSLPGGHWDGAGHRQREVEVRALTGREEEGLAAADADDVAALVTTVLAACLVRLGDLSPVPVDLVRRLTVADREYLMLLVRRITFGDEVRANLQCPWEGCAEQVTVDVSLSDLPVRESATSGPLHVVRLSSDAAAGGPARLEVRLPDGRDQEELSALALRDEALALSALLARVVLRVDDEPARTDQVTALTPLARAEIEAELERVAPLVESAMDVRCAGCGRGFVAPLDLRRLFFGELRTDSELLYREVHFLALNYHWSEPDILAMSRPKRRGYLDLLADEIEGTHSVG
jgi:hypothetical protein